MKHFLPPTPIGYITAMNSKLDPETVKRLKDAWKDSYPNYILWTKSFIIKRKSPSYNHQLKRLIKRRSS